MTTNTRIRYIGSPGITGTFVRYYAPLPSGKRRTQIMWDDRSLIDTPLETQIEAF